MEIASMRERPYSPEMLDLAEKWIQGTITPEEKALLFEWYDCFDDTELSVELEQAAALSRMKRDMLQDIRRQIKPTPKVRRPGRLSVAAALLLLLATGGWLALYTPSPAPLANAA